MQKTKEEKMSKMTSEQALDWVIERLKREGKECALYRPAFYPNKSLEVANTLEELKNELFEPKKQ